MGKYKRIYIIGFPKCGSTSFRSYLRKRFGKVDIFTFPGFSLYNPRFEKDWMRGEHIDREDSLYVIIIRDPYERLWSSYWWGVHRWKTMSDTTPIPTFKDFLYGKTNNTDLRWVGSGLGDPVGACDYDVYIKKAYKLGIEPIVVRFEDMKLNPNYPHEAETVHIIKTHTGRDIKKPPLDEANRKLISDALKERGINDFY